MSGAWRVAQVLGGTTLGLALAEAGFAWHDGGGFPHLNLYVADAELGVRLLPGGTERIVYGANPATDVRINSEGYRGEDWGPPAADEIVVIGDSQVFGLGVEADETASAVLARAAGRPVRNAGVPTYGPVEYAKVIDELLASRHPKTVVLVLNFANDLFEIDSPNTGRHAVWDGWAVRRETAPAEVTDFPGRHWLYNQSHLFHAMRTAWWTPPEGWGKGVASEGTWRQVLAASEKVASERPDPVAQEAALAATVQQAAADRSALERSLTDLYFDIHPEVSSADDGLGLEALAQWAQPGDIVSEHFGEEGGRSVPVTAGLLRQGAALQKNLAKRLGDWATEHPTDRRATAITDALARRTTLDGELASLTTRVAADVGGRSPFYDLLVSARDACTAVGAELVVAALPLDVQVSDTEWAKYGAEPEDMSGSLALLADLVRTAETLGIRALDLTPALVAAEPGAFLDGDLHMTPKGQAAAGEAIAARLSAPLPFARPGAGLEPGRSRVPTIDELLLAPEVTVKGSTAAHCSTRGLREWLFVWCRPRMGDTNSQESYGYESAYYSGEKSVPLGLAVREGEEVLTGVKAHYSTLMLTPLVPGRDVTVDFWFSDRAEQLAVRWEGETWSAAFSPLANAGPAPAVPRPGGDTCRVRERSAVWTGAVDRGCADTYDQCAELLDCGAGTRGHLPTCAEGQAIAGSAGHCHDLCDAAHPCARGTCSDWQGGRVCL